MKPSIILSITLVLAFTICQEVKSQFNFNDLNEQQCLYFENNNNRMLLQCTNNHDVAAAYFQMIAPGTSPAYYLIAVKFRGESQFFKYKFYNPSGNVLGKTQSGYLKFTTRNGNFVIGKAYGGSPSGAERQLVRTAEKYDSEEQMKHFIRRSLEKTGLIKSMADKLFEYLLAYSSGWDLPELEKVDADPLFSRYWMDVVFSLESKGFMTESSFSPLSCSVLADVSLLARAFDNISSNVEKYSDPSVPVVFACFREDDMVCIRISNGILPQPLKKDSSGIGLRTCRRIAGYHNGSFSYRAEGGVFVEEIRLPVFKSDSTE